MVRHSNLLDVSFGCLKLLRQRPHDGIIGVVLATALALIIVCFYFLLAMQVMYINGDLNIVAQCGESFTNFSQIFTKLIPLHYYKKRLRKLFEDHHRYFWNVSKFPELVKEIEEMYRISYLWQVFYKWSLVFTLALFFLQPIFQRKLLILVWIPNIKYSYEVLQVGEYMIGSSALCFMLGFDNFFVSMCTFLTAQFKMMGAMVRSLNIEDKDFEYTIRMFVDHHNMLTSFTKELIEIYTASFLVQYLLTIGGVCMQMYFLTESSSGPLRIIQCVIFCLCLLAQMGLICFPASAVTDEAAKLAHSIYESNWYNGPVGRQKDIQFLMMRAQKELKFTAGGLADINRAAYTVVLKTTMSFFTLMRNMQDR